MKFIKQIPLQNSRSPRITREYFDDEANLIMDIGAKHNYDLYYVVSNAIKIAMQNKTTITELNRHERVLGDKFPQALIDDLNNAGYKTTEWTVDHKNGWIGTGNKIIIKK